MKTENKTKKDFSRTNWEISTTIVGAHLLMGISPGVLDLEIIQKEIIEDVFFENLIRIGDDRINNGLSSHEENEIYKAVCFNTVVIHSMADYSSFIEKYNPNLEAILKIDIPLYKDGLIDFLEDTHFENQEDMEIAAMNYTITNSIAHEILNNKDVLKIILEVYELLSSKFEMKKKHLGIHKVLGNLINIDRKKFSWS